MGLITGTLTVLGLVLTSPLWIPLTLGAIFAPEVFSVLLGVLLLLTSPLWVPLALVGVPLLLVTSPAWVPVALIIAALVIIF